MSKIIYPVQRYQNLFIINAAVGSTTTQPKVIRMLVDTGASYTLISSRVLTTAGGSLQAPIVLL